MSLVGRRRGPPAIRTRRSFYPSRPEKKTGHIGQLQAMETTPGPPDPSTDAEHIVASAADPARFGVIFDRHVGAIHGYLFRRVGAMLTEDLTSETFVVAFRARSGYDAARPDARPWLYGVATNLVHRHARSERRQLAAFARVVDPRGQIHTDEGVEARLDASALGPRLAAALASLATGDRDALLLHAWEDLSYREIAEALGVAVGTVGSRLARARRVLQPLFADHLDGGDLPETPTRRNADG
jgi:RNA polymerase sigma factor (sigma-70 family)